MNVCGIADWSEQTSTLRTNRWFVLVVESLFLVLMASGATFAFDGMVYWTDTGVFGSGAKIHRADMNGSNMEDIVDLAGYAYPYGIALHGAEGKIYWTDGTGKIQRANMTGSHVEDVIATGLSIPYGIALDIHGGKMYWTDYGLSSIYRADLDGSGKEILVSGLTTPRGIVLNVAAGTMFWTDSATGKIQRSSLDGTGVTDLVTAGNPYDIALDVDRGKMYWVDPNDTIYRANLDGTGAEDLVSGLTSPVGISLDTAASKMYWTDAGTGKIQRADLDGSKVEDLLSGLTAPQGIAVFPSVPGAVADYLGSLDFSSNEATVAKGNAYRIDTTTNLMEAEFWLYPYHPQTLHFYVYKSWAEFGTYFLIYQSSKSVTGTAEARWYSTGQIYVPLEAGAYHIIAVSWSGSMRYWYDSWGGEPISFGKQKHAYATGTHPLGSTIDSTIDDTAIFRQRLTTDTHLRGAVYSGRHNNTLRRVDPITYATHSSTPATLAGATVQAVVAMTAHPYTGMLYAILRLVGQVGYELVTLNPATGVATSIGDTGEPVGSIDFRSNGMLYGVVGSAANTLPANSLCVLNQTDGTLGYIGLLSGQTGHSIAFNHNDGLLYHLSGTYSTRKMESVDVVTLEMNNIPLSGSTWQTGSGGMTYAGSDVFLCGDHYMNSMFRLSSTGVASHVKSVPAGLRSLALNQHIFLFLDGFESGNTSAWSVTTE